MLTLLLLLLVWWLAGVWSFLYWWHREFDITVGDIFAALFLGGLMGPVTWLICWIALGGLQAFWGRVVFPRKRSSDGKA